MGKSNKSTPELTLEALTQAIRAYRREDVAYLLQKGILKEIPESEKISVYRELVSLQNPDIISAIAKQETHLPPEIFDDPSRSSQSKSFVCQCFTKFRKQFNYESTAVCNQLFTISCECGCTGMINYLIEKGKAKDRYHELGGCSLDTLKQTKKLTYDLMPADELVQFYLAAFTTAEREAKFTYLTAHGFDLFIKDHDGKNILFYLKERISSGKYPKNRHGSLLQTEDRNIYEKLKKLKSDLENPSPAKETSKKKLALIISAVCVIVLIIAIAIASEWKGKSTSDNTGEAETSTSEPSQTSDTSETDSASNETSDASETSYDTDNSLTVADGDKVNIDYTGYIDGTAFSGGSTNGNGADLTIGSGTYIDDFEDQLIGAHPGDQVTVNVTFPDTYNNSDLAGKDAEFDVTVNGIYK